MCGLTRCCFFFSLRNGCIIGAFIELISSSLHTLIYFLLNADRFFNSDEKAIYIFEISFRYLCATVLLIGAIYEVRVCLILHIVFITAVIVATITVELVLNGSDLFYDWPVWLLVYLFVAHVFLTYMIFVSFEYFLELNKLHQHLVSYPVGSLTDMLNQRPMGSALLTEVYEM